MRITFEGQDYDFDFERALDTNRARYIKRMLGFTIKGLRDGVTDLDPDALIAIYYLMKAEAGQTVDVNKVNFNVAEFGAAFDKAAEEAAENPTQSTPSESLTESSQSE
jgi:hypothetical protein